jgi:MYXO-CTERM domain-containing protein
VKRALAGLAVALSVVTASPSLLANGRFPQANQIAFAAGGPDLLVRTTFGLLVSHDRGKTFRWVCEQVVGYSGVQDPGIGLFSDGSLAVASFEGLAMSHDSGCSWAFASGGLGGEYVIDVAIEPKSPLRGVAITSTGVSGGAFHVQVFETADGGNSWAPVGAALPTDLLAETIDLAPSDPMRLYVSGTFFDAGGTKQGALETSGDRGKTWTRTVIPIPGDSAVYIGGVDPTDAGRVYLRTRGNGKNGSDAGVTDRLLVSKDGGASVQEVTSVTGPLAGFAISPDGTRVAIGSQAAGLLVAGRADLVFTPVAMKAVQCLAWDADGLYVCGSDFADGFTIGRTTDEGKTFTPLLAKLADIAGPLDTCTGDGAYSTQCGPVWPMLQQLFGVGTTGGAGGQPAAAGAGGSGGIGGAPAAGGTGGGSSGCGCEIGPKSASGGGLLALLGVAVAASLLRKRRDIA